MTDAFHTRRGAPFAQRRSLQGNPAVKENWSRLPAGSVVDRDGVPTPEFFATREDRLDNWHMLQEVAGFR